MVVVLVELWVLLLEQHFLASVYCDHVDHREKKNAADVLSIDNRPIFWYTRGAGCSTRPPAITTNVLLLVEETEVRWKIRI